MSSTRSTLPKEVTQGYWNEVVICLINKYHLSKKDAGATARTYRDMLFRDGVKDTVYHAPIDETVNGIVVGGYVIQTKQIHNPSTPAKSKAIIKTISSKSKSDKRTKPSSKTTKSSSAKSSLKQVARKAAKIK